MVDIGVLFTNQLIITVSAFAGIAFGWWMKPQWDHWMAPLYTRFVGVGSDGFYVEQKVGNGQIEKGEFQVDGGPIVPINPETRYVNKKTGQRTVVYNHATGFGLKPKNRIVALVDNFDAAVIQKGRSIERILNFMGFPWALAIIGGVLLLLGVFAILFVGVGWVYTQRMGGG